MNKIKHSGVVEQIENGCVKVRILQSSACSGCKVAAHCNASETKEKMIDVPVGEVASRYQVGEHVVVGADASVGFRASLYAYLTPLVVMVLTLIVVLMITRSEGTAALAALVVLVPYYLGLYLFRNKLKAKLNFEILN